MLIFSTKLLLTLISFSVIIETEVIKMNYTSEYKSSEYLHINSCDCQHLYGCDVGSLRENGRVDYHILFITEGCCFVTDNDTVSRVEAGSVIVYLPHERQQYHFKGDIKSTSYYAHFSGTGCKEILDNFGFNQRYFYVGKAPRAEELFKRMTEEYFLKRPYSDKLCSSYLYSILALLGRKKSFSAGDSVKVSNRIEQVCRDMICNYFKPLDLDAYAIMCNLSTSRFVHLFKECTGNSPKNYLIWIRIKKACELLENTDLSILKIGEQVGIDDQNYFSRLFKKYTSKSPSEYRKSFM